SDTSHLPERRLTQTIRDRVIGRGASCVHSANGRVQTMINDLDLAGFVTGAIARGRITFGDVRRLQRDYLPGGIEARAQAESLAALADGGQHADRSWKQWFAATLTEFATKGVEGDAAARDETVVWLERLSEKPGFARRTG